MKLCTDKKLATVNTMGCPHPQKSIPTKIYPVKYCDDEISTLMLLPPGRTGTYNSNLWIVFFHSPECVCVVSISYYQEDL